MISIEQANAAVAAMKNRIQITPQEVASLLDNTRGVTFAAITTVSKVALAAAHKHVEIYKVVTANVQLFNNVTADVYAQAVKRSAEKLGGDASGFVTSAAHFIHTPECYSVVHNPDLDTYYLYAIYNSSKSVYVMNGELVSKTTVALHCTPSAARAMLSDNKVITNIKNDVKHDVIVRTPKLSSIVSITAMKQTASVY